MVGAAAYSAGEIYSTVEDLYRWNKALNEGKLINKQSLNKMFTPYLEDYGYGWYITNKDNDKIVFHGGYIPDYNSYIIRNINKKYVITILSNDQSSYKKVRSMSLILLDILKAEN